MIGALPFYYFGEAFCAALPEYEALYPAILYYAFRELKDDSGLGIAICDGNAGEIEAPQALAKPSASAWEAPRRISEAKPALY